MSASDVIYACGCFSYASDCCSPGSGGFCAEHKPLYDDVERITDLRRRFDKYAALWRRIAHENKGKKNWGAA